MAGQGGLACEGAAWGLTDEHGTSLMGGRRRAIQKALEGLKNLAEHKESLRLLR